MEGIKKVLSLGGDITDLEEQRKYNQRVSFMTDSGQVEKLRDTERRFQRYTKITKYMNYAITGMVAALPAAAYLNPDFDGIENIAASALGIFSLFATPTVWYVGHFGDYPKLEQEYRRRVDVLETRLRDLRQRE